MFCIKCGTEMEEMFPRCPYCYADLLGGQQDELEEHALSDFFYASEMDWEMATFMVAANTAEAAAVRDLLDAAGIPMEIRAAGSSGEPQGAVLNGICILVPEPLREYATSLLMSARAQDRVETETVEHEKSSTFGGVTKGLGFFTLLAGIIAMGFKALKNRLQSA